jgi:hypothetical protein
MASIKAYIYNTELEVQNAINSINSSLVIPKSAGSITQTYTNYEFNNSKYIIRHDEEIDSVLGLPSDFDYITPIIENPFI